MVRIVFKKEPKYLKKHEALPYQEQAFRAIRDLDYAGIFHEQGLGKTKIAIDLMLYWFEKKIIDTVIVVAKKTLIKNWTKELEIHTFLKPKIISQTPKLNYYVFNSPARVILTHYEAIRTELERLKLFLKTRDVALILDESVKIKNPNSKITKAVFEIAPLAKKRVIMTGTPSANRPFDFWAQIRFLDFGKSLGNDFKKFVKEHNLSNVLYKNSEARELFEKEVSKIFAKISPFTVRDTKSKGVLTLPRKIIDSIKTEWEPVQLEMYKQLREEERAIILRDGVPTEDKAEVVLKRLIRLIEITSNPRLLDESYSKEPGKLPYLVNLINQIYRQDEKSIIWTSFIKNADWLKEELLEFGSCKVHGKMGIDDRNATLEKFLSDSNYRILIATPGSAKEGLTLTVANHVIFYDRGFSLDDYLQAQDRIHRISQERTCYVHNLIMRDSIDEWIDILLQSKELAAQLAQGDISLDYYRGRISYSYGEIIRNILNIGA